MRPFETRFGWGGACSKGETSRPTGSPSRAAPVFGGAGAAVAHRARHQFAVVVDRRPVVPAMRVEIPRPVHQPNRQGREHRPPGELETRFLDTFVPRVRARRSLEPVKFFAQPEHPLCDAATERVRVHLRFCASLSEDVPHNTGRLVRSGFDAHAELLLCDMPGLTLAPGAGLLGLAVVRQEVVTAGTVVDQAVLLSETERDCVVCVSHLHGDHLLSRTPQSVRPTWRSANSWPCGTGCRSRSRARLPRATCAGGSSDCGSAGLATSHRGPRFPSAHQLRTVGFRRTAATRSSGKPNG